jgi:cell division protein FtsB
MNVAEKTIAKIAKEQKKLDTLVAKRNEYNANVQAKLDSMNEDIKEQKAVIAELRKQEKVEKLEAISTMMNDKGISVDDLLNAVANNDLYAIQESMESSEKSASDSEDTAGDDAAETVSTSDIF